MIKLLKPRTQVRVTRRWLRRVGLVFLFSCFLVLIFYLLFKSNLFTIRNVNCWVQDKTSLADEKRWCDAVERDLLGQRILYPKIQAAASQIGHRFLPVGEVKITRKYPQTVLVQISERKPLAKVGPPGGQEFLVDDEGAVFSQVTPETENLRKITLELEDGASVGQTISSDIVFLIRLEEPKIASIKYIDQGGIEVQAGENLTILFSRQKSIEAQIRSLQMIVKKYKIEGKQLQQVDLRYEQPVVRY